MTASSDDALWRSALAQFDALVDREPSARAVALAALAAEDAALAGAVQRMLEADAAAPADALGRGVAARAERSAPDPRLGQRVGPYRLEAVIGEGGMGTVFRAVRVDGGFAQAVAIKCIRGGGDGAAARQRFERERAILARLAHPDIASVLDGGVDDHGAPWYAMPLIEGEPVTRWCDARHLPLRERIALLARIADAVQAAHGALVVHRDLKPSNILVDAQGAPHLLDFGIAKLLDAEDASATGTAARLLTPAYAAPEQIRGEPVSTATDVFALGVVLFELACGRHPFADDTRSGYAVERAVVEGAAPRLAAALTGEGTDVAERAARRGSTPERLRRALRGDLERIVRKALAKTPAARYVSAAAFAEDLRHWLAGRPVAATPESPAYRFGLWLRRWRWAVAGVAVVGVALVAATAISLRAAGEARRAQRDAEANLQSARAVQGFLEGVFLAAEPWKHDGKLPDALALADRVFATLDRDLANQPLARADLYASLSRLYTTAGDGGRAVLAAERADALHAALGSGAARRFEVGARLAYAYGFVGRWTEHDAMLARLAASPDLARHERFVLATMQAQRHRDRGRYDLAQAGLEAARAIGAGLSDQRETAFALGNNERVLRRYADAARHLLAQDRERDDAASRGWRALMAIYRFDLLPEAWRRPADLAWAAAFEAERAAVWPDGTWRELFTALRVRLHRQHGDRATATALARGLPLTPDVGDAQLAGYDAEAWLELSYALLAGGERVRAAAQFARLARALQGVSDPLDPRLALARLGAACARGDPLSAELAAVLAAPPQPDHLGYAWLAETPCPALRESPAARHAAPQDRALGAELRAAIDAAVARLGDCRDGPPVAVGAPCAVTPRAPADAAIGR